MGPSRLRRKRLLPVVATGGLLRIVASCSPHFPMGAPVLGTCCSLGLTDNREAAVKNYESLLRLSNAPTMVFPLDLSCQFLSGLVEFVPCACFDSKDISAALKIASFSPTATRTDRVPRPVLWPLVEATSLRVSPFPLCRYRRNCALWLNSCGRLRPK
jgi:hypothetical protein